MKITITVFITSLLFSFLFIAAQFLPARVGYWFDYSAPAAFEERCRVKNLPEEVFVQTTPFLLDYYMLYQEQDGDESYGPCAYQNYTVETYGVELLFLSATIGAYGLYRLKMDNK